MSIEIKLWPLSREITQENPPEILQTWLGKLRIKLSFPVFYKTALPLAFPPKSFSPVPMEILMTVILDKKPLLLKSVNSILIFHLKNFPPILSLSLYYLVLDILVPAKVILYFVAKSQ